MSPISPAVESGGLMKKTSWSALPCSCPLLTRTWCLVVSPKCVVCTKLLYPGNFFLGSSSPCRLSFPIVGRIWSLARVGKHSFKKVHISLLGNETCGHWDLGSANHAGPETQCWQGLHWSSGRGDPQLC